MTIAEIVALIPEDKRAGAEADLVKLEKASKIDSKEVAETLATTNPFVRSVIDSFVSKEVLVHDARFMAEKLPKIVDDEIKKRNPAKDPRDIALEEMQTKFKTMEQTALREQQRSRAIAKLSEKGLPDKLAEFYLGTTDEETDAKLNLLFEHLTPWKDKAIEATLKERFGNNPIPPAGTPPPKPLDLKAAYDKALVDGNADLALSLQSKMHAQMGTSKT